MHTTTSLATLFVTSLLICCLAAPGQAAESKFLGSIWKGSQSNSDALFGTLFNQLTPENAGKWGSVQSSQGSFSWGTLDQMFAFAASKGILVKQHCFVWGQQQPGWVNSGNAGTAVPAWISAFMARYGDQPAFIDVVNEALAGHAPAGYKDGLGGDGATGYDWVIASFQHARQYAPHAKLLYNDYNILNGNSSLSEYLKICTLLHDRGLIDGLGEQAHFLEGTSAADITARLDSLAQLGLPIYISEYDLDIADDAQHAAVFSAQFSAFWEHPAVKGVTLWGHRQGQMWRTNGYLVRSDGSERPALTWLRSYLANPPIPSVLPLSLSTAQGVTRSVTLAGSLGNGGPLTYAVTQPAHGSVTLSGSTATYTPGAGYSGSDTFTYTATDAVRGGVSAPATVSVTVHAAGWPVITSQSGDAGFIAGQSLSLTVTASGSAPLTWQWTRGGSPVGGNAATLAIASAQAGDAGTYVCTVSNALGSSASDPMVLTLRPPVAINCGGGATGYFTADQSFTGGSAYVSAATVSTAGVANAAPAALYQSERWGEMGYAISGLTPGAVYTVRLHFAEVYWTTAGQRVFNVTINGSVALGSLDIYALAGANHALVREAAATADSGGGITIAFHSLVDNAKVSGIEVFPTAAAPKAGDGNGDGVVDAADLAIVNGQFGRNGADVTDARADLDHNGRVDAVDLGLVVRNQGR